MQDVITALEAATEGSPDLDLMIWRKVSGEDWCWLDQRAETITCDRHGPGAVGNPVVSLDRYTRDFEAALLLVPPTHDYEVNITGTPDGETYTCAGLRYWHHPRKDQETAWCHRDGNKLTPPHALCIAALKARADLAEPRT